MRARNINYVTALHVDSGSWSMARGSGNALVSYLEMKLNKEKRTEKVACVRVARTRRKSKSKYEYSSLSLCLCADAGVKVYVSGKRCESIRQFSIWYRIECTGTPNHVHSNSKFSVLFINTRPLSGSLSRCLFLSSSI